MEISILPKDIQYYILKFISYPSLPKELLEDIRDFTESLQQLQEIFQKKIKIEFGNDIEEYSQIEIDECINYTIYYTIAHLKRPPKGERSLYVLW